MKKEMRYRRCSFLVLSTQKTNNKRKYPHPAHTQTNTNTLMYSPDNYSPMPTDEYPYRKQTQAILKAAIAVYNNLGVGFLEAVYQEALEIELRKQNIPFESQKTLKIYYQGEELRKTYIADIICYGEIILELKVIAALTKTEGAQLINYLKASGKQVGLLINYGAERKLEWKRYIFTNTTYLTKQNIPEKI